MKDENLRAVRAPALKLKLKRQHRGNIDLNQDDLSERIEPKGKKHSDPGSKFERRDFLTIRVGIAQALTMSWDGQIFRTGPTQDLGLER